MSLRIARRLYIANAFASPIGIALAHCNILKLILVLASIAIYIILSNQLVRATAAATLTHVIAQTTSGHRAGYARRPADESTPRVDHA